MWDIQKAPGCHPAICKRRLCIRCRLLIATNWFQPSISKKKLFTQGICYLIKPHLHLLSLAKTMFLARGSAQLVEQVGCITSHLSAGSPGLAVEISIEMWYDFLLITASKLPEITRLTLPPPALTVPLSVMVHRNKNCWVSFPSSIRLSSAQSLWIPGTSLQEETAFWFSSRY